MMMKTLKQRGTWLSWREELKIVMKTAASWSAQCFRVEDDRHTVRATLRAPLSGTFLQGRKDVLNLCLEVTSGPAAVWLFCFPKSHLTSHSSTMKGGGRAALPGGGEAVTGVEFRVTVKPSVKTIQLVGQVGVVVWDSSTLPLVVVS